MLDYLADGYGVVGRPRKCAERKNEKKNQAW
jgi:hypothetical protein